VYVCVIVGFIETLYQVNLLSLLIPFHRFCRDHEVFTITVTIYTSKQFNFFYHNIFSLSCLYLKPRTPSTMLNSNHESKHPGLFPVLGRKVLEFHS
jgi:hypothetical protein